MLGLLRPLYNLTTEPKVLRAILSIEAEREIDEKTFYQPRVPTNNNVPNVTFRSVLYINMLRCEYPLELWHHCEAS